MTVLRDWAADIVVCPTCAGRLTEADGALSCPREHVWPIRDGVPSFVPGQHYAGSFGFQWQRFDRVQLDSEASRESEETFTSKTGLTQGDVQGRTILDVGCGMGRFSDVVGRWGGRVIGIDLSDAVHAAQRNLGDRDNVRILQADVFSLPLAERSFDLVFSLGVLHHTPDTRRAFLALPRLVKPGGTVAIWVYWRGLRRIHPGSEVLRPLTSRVDPERLLKIMRRVVPPLSKANELPVIGRPIRKLLPTSLHPDPEWRVLDTFDWYSPRYQHKHTYDEVEAWFRDAGLVDLERFSFPVSVRGRKPR